MAAEAVRAKFVLSEIRQQGGSQRDQATGKRVVTQSAPVLMFRSEENSETPASQRYAKASPDGFVQIRVDNPAVLARFEIGKAYYFDITEAP